MRGPNVFNGHWEDPGATAAVLEAGAERARSLAVKTLARARDAVGLLPRA